MGGQDRGILLLFAQRMPSPDDGYGLGVCRVQPSLPSPPPAEQKGSGVTVAIHRWIIKGPGALSHPPAVTEPGPDIRGEFTG